MKFTKNPKTLGDEHINDKFDFVNDETDPDIGRRVIALGDREYFLRAKDPYALWTIHAKQGTVPVELQGSFTSVKAAEDALANYTARRSREGIIAKKHKEALGPNFDTRSERKIKE